MYQTTRLAFTSPKYNVQSYGNGCAYLITRNSDGAGCALQGDDATIFGGAMEAAYMAGRKAIDDLCEGYSEVMT